MPCKLQTKMGLVVVCLAVIVKQCLATHCLHNGECMSLQKSSFFVPVEGYVGNWEYMKVEKMHHRCSMTPHCNYLVYDIKVSECRMVTYARDLPSDKTKNVVWKKIPDKMHSCLDWQKTGVHVNGIYHIFDGHDTSFPVYCDFQSEKNSTWTLIMSFAYKNLAKFRTPMFLDSIINEDNPTWEEYRLSKHRMEMLRSESRLWRATCDFPVHGVDYGDYLRASSAKADLFGSYDGHCLTVEYIDIGGKQGSQVKVPFYQNSLYAFHIDVTHVDCGFTRNWGSSYDMFGFYGSIDANFRCTKGGESTTQYWYGDENA